MDYKLFLGYTGIWLTLISAIWKIFGYIAEVSSQEFNDKVSYWIDNIGVTKINSNSKEIIYGMFIKFFGEKHFSLKCIKRSIFYSICVIIIIILISFIEFSLSQDSDIIDESTTKLDFWHSFGILMPIFFVIFLQDYLILLKTRIFLKRIQHNKFPQLISTVIFIDLLITTGIVLVVIFIASFCTFLFVEISQQKYVSVFGLFKISGILFIRTFTEKDSVFSYHGFGKIYLSSYLGTFWILLIFLTGVFTSIYSKIPFFLGKLKKVIDIQGKPIKSLGVIMILTVSVVYLLSLPILIGFYYWRKFF